MAGFRFAFNTGEDDGGSQPALPPRAFPPASEVMQAMAPAESSAPEHDIVEIAPGLTLLKGRVSGAEAAKILADERVEGSDLVEQVYEGGFKLWEGAIDMCHYLIQKYKLKPEQLVNGTSDGESWLQGKKILELGCGHGLPGILAMLAGAEVHFQDFNREVLSSLTIPNVRANLARLPAGRCRPSCRFFAGDWSSVGELLTAQGFGGHYDLILTSESIYNLDSQHRLLECIKQVVQPPHGVVLVAAKSYYFGVGGGIKTFTKTVKHDGIFEVNSVYKTTADVTAAINPVTAVQAADGDGAARAAPADGDAAGAGEKAEAEAAGAAAAAKAGAGGNVREVLELSFPISIQPYFL